MLYEVLTACAEVKMSYNYIWVLLRFDFQVPSLLNILLFEQSLKCDSNFLLKDFEITLQEF